MKLIFSAVLKISLYMPLTIFKNAILSLGSWNKVFFLSFEFLVHSWCFCAGAQRHTCEPWTNQNNEWNVPSCIFLQKVRNGLLILLNEARVSRIHRNFLSLKSPLAKFVFSMCVLTIEDRCIPWKFTKTYHQVCVHVSVCLCVNHTKSSDLFKGLNGHLDFQKIDKQGREWNRNIKHSATVILNAQIEKSQLGQGDVS